MPEKKGTNKLFTFLEMFFGNIYIGFSVYILIFAIIGFLQSILTDSGKDIYIFSIRNQFDFTISRSTYVFLLAIFLYILRIINKKLETKINIKNSNKFKEFMNKNKQSNDTDVVANEIALNMYDAIKYMNFTEFYYDHLDRTDDKEMELFKTVYYQSRVWYLRKRVLGHLLSLFIFFTFFLITDFSFSMSDVINTIFLSIFVFQLLNILIYGFKYLINFFALSIPDSKDRMTIILALFGTIISLIALFKK